MSKKLTLDLRGVLWNKLGAAEKSSIADQMPKILSDPNIELYRFITSLKDNTWSIVNAMAVPLKTSSMVL